MTLCIVIIENTKTLKFQEKIRAYNYETVTILSPTISIK
jgi:hypothetical protein